MHYTMAISEIELAESLNRDLKNHNAWASAYNSQMQRPIRPITGQILNQILWIIHVM